MSDSVVHSTQAQTLDNTLGAVFVGVIISSILFGVSTLQVYYYYHYYPHDSRLHKISVGVLWVLDATHLGLTVFASYNYGVRGFGHIDGLAVVIWPIKLQTAINVVIILMVQSLYAYRVWLLGGYHHGILGYLVAGVVLGGFGIGIVLAVETYSINSWANIGDIAWAVQSSFAASTMIDIVISVAMCYYLRKSKGAESRLNSRISTLMQYTLSCGVFTSACSVSALFTFITMPNNMVFLSLSYLLTRLYMNSFMAMMNARQRIQRPENSTFVLSNNISSAAFTTSTPRVPRSRSDRSDPESQYRSPDKEDWIDAPMPTLNGTYVPHMNGPALHDTREVHGYARQW